MVGEIRDVETAQVAVDAALSGQLILSTLHTNDAASGLTRLLELGIEDYLVASTVNALVAQRLVRTLCRLCRRRFEPPRALAERLIAAGAPAEALTVFEPVGCPECGGSGFSGRTTIAEVLPVDEGIRRHVFDRTDAPSIQRSAVAAGFRTMFDDGLAKAAAGVTSLGEVMRVCREQ